MENTEILPNYWLCKPLGEDAEGIFVLFSGSPAFFAKVIPSTAPMEHPHQVHRIWTAGKEGEYDAGYLDEMELIASLQEAGILPPDVNSKHTRLGQV